MKYKSIRERLASKSKHAHEILRGATSAFILKILAAGIAFGYNVLLARLLGADNTGLYYLAFTIVFIGATIGRFGLDNTVLRFTSIARTQDDPSTLHGIYEKAVLVTAIFSIVVTVLIALSSNWLSEIVFNSPNLTLPLQIMSLSVTPIALYTIHASALQGMKHVKAYVSVLSLWNPLFAAVAVPFVAPFWGLNGAIVMYVIGSLLTLVISFVQWKKAVASYKRAAAHFSTDAMLASCIPLFISSLLRLVIERSSIILLGLWVTNSEVGIFSVAHRLAMLTSLVLVAVNSVSAPLYASLYQQQNTVELERTAKATTKLLMLIATPILAFFLLFPDNLLAIFGSEFKHGALALTILAIGQYVNLITGSVGYLLVMSGNESLVKNNLIFSACLCLVANIILIPWQGIVGAAIATAFTVATQNIIATYLVKKKLGFVVLPFIPDRKKDK